MLFVYGVETQNIASLLFCKKIYEYILLIVKKILPLHLIYYGL